MALCAVGAAAQAWATRQDQRRFPPPGLLVDVGGHRAALDVRGAGDGPTIVLEAGMGSFSANWYWVQTELATSNRVVAYDRAGLGWSERGSRPRDATTIAVELHTALHGAGIDGPFVLAGHSFGGLLVRAFAAQYPAETVGLVLVDASHPDQWLRWPIHHADRLFDSGAAGHRDTGPARVAPADRPVPCDLGRAAGAPGRRAARPLGAAGHLRGGGRTDGGLGRPAAPS